jgi:ketosteroid isomerase-like protein
MKMTTLFGRMLTVWAILSCQAGFTQPSSGQAAGFPDGPNGKAINAYYTAFEKKDWNMMQGALADGFTFTSPLDDHISLKAFKVRCWPNADNIKRFELDKVVVSGDSAFVIYNGWTTSGKLFRNSDYFTFKDGKISTYECFFGPGINYPNSGK